ncbi:MAG TPA: hypothetical protein VMW27_25610 [Thermoanaerobaculia bacterium]|nr:hypothetical protein [Thermoanaerobaculia bacterium]
MGGIEQFDLGQLQSWAQGGSISYVEAPRTTVNRVMLGAVVRFIAAKGSDKSQAEETLLDLLKAQTIPNGCGLYAVWPGPRARTGRTEERTTSHAQLYYGAIGAALLATRGSRSDLARTLEEWLYHDMSWCHHCYTPFGVVAAGCRVNKNDGTFAPTDGNRDQIYRTLAGISGRGPEVTHRSQLGFALIQQLWLTKEHRLVRVAGSLRAIELAVPSFWYRFEIGITPQAIWTWCPTMAPTKLNAVVTYASRDGSGGPLRLSKEELPSNLGSLDFETHLVIPGIEERKERSDG